MVAQHALAQHLTAVARDLTAEGSAEKADQLRAEARELTTKRLALARMETPGRLVGDARFRQDVRSGRSRKLA